MKMINIFACMALLWFAPACQSRAQAAPDPELLSAITAIKVIDNHAHPLRALKEGERDTEWGELGYHALEAAGGDPVAEMALVPFRLRPESPEITAVWHALYGLPKGAVTKELLDEVVRVKRQAMAEQGDNYPASVLDKIGVETVLANRAVMDRSLPAPRFRWVAYADALMFPFGNKDACNKRPELVRSYDGLARLMKRHLADLQLSHLPFSLKEYLTKVVTPTMERQKQGGAVAVKFLTAYLRTLSIADPSEAQAGSVYDRYVKGERLTASHHRILEDYLFRYISREAGRLNVAVHIHTGFGIGRYFDIVGSNPLLLEPVFNDPLLRKTPFVIIHGGWPFARQAAAMLLKPNVYIDFSAIAFLLYPRELSNVIRAWLEISPDKVLFGTDGFELNPKMSYFNWEEFVFLATGSARDALALALTDMMHDNEITQAEALDIARGVLRENAVKLYKLQTQKGSKVDETVSH